MATGASPGGPAAPVNNAVTVSVEVEPEAVRAQLERILTSPGFIHSRRLVRFLRFIVERALEGQNDSFKEYVLGVEVFDRGTAFDPRIDPIVRVEARRLRTKLRQYYKTDGRNDAVLISFCKGSYLPVFRRRVARNSRRPAHGSLVLSVADWKTELRPVIDRAIQEGRAITVTAVRPDNNGDSAPWEVAVVPLAGSNGVPKGASIELRRCLPWTTLQDGFPLLRDGLSETVQRLEKTNSELATTNEELLQTLERLTAANDQSEAAREARNLELRVNQTDLARRVQELAPRSEELATANVLLDSLMSTLDVAVVGVDRQLRVLLWNDKAQNLWGHDGSQVLGQSLLSLNPPFFTEKLKAALRACLAGKSEAEELSVPHPRFGSLKCRLVAAGVLAFPRKPPQAVILLMREQR